MTGRAMSRGAGAWDDGRGRVWWMGGRPGARETAGPTCLLARAMQGGRCEMATFIISKKKQKLAWRMMLVSLKVLG
jgi:hypothetical protein